MASARFTSALLACLICLLWPSVATISAGSALPKKESLPQQHQEEGPFSLKHQSPGVGFLPIHPPIISPLAEDQHGEGDTATSETRTAGGRPDKEESTSTDNLRSGVIESPVLSFTSSNSYPEIAWSPWTHHLAEPYRAAVLKANSSAGNLESDVFVWTIPGENGAVYEGRYELSVHHVFNELLYDTFLSYQKQMMIRTIYIEYNLRQLVASIYYSGTVVYIVFHVRYHRFVLHWDEEHLSNPSHPGGRPGSKKEKTLVADPSIYLFARVVRYFHVLVSAWRSSKTIGSGERNGTKPLAHNLTTQAFIHVVCL